LSCKEEVNLVNNRETCSSYPYDQTMCGIAGYSLRSRSNVERTLAAQALLAAIAERGADAVGYAYRAQSEKYPTVVKQANNHPVRHGPIVGIHNGIITNDDELLAPHSCARAEPRMTVDSEAIFAVAAHSRNDPRALENLRGAMATAWIDEREPDTLFLARGAGRPMWLGEGRESVFFASTEGALGVVERYCGLRLRKREVKHGTLLAVRNGQVTRRERFRPDLDYVESDPLPAVRAPAERDSCLLRLAALAAVA
jgi:asparagine synthetase B (glutamine-hydrolysing)